MEFEREWEEDESLVLAFDESEPVTLSPDDERELLDRLEAITRGEYVDGDEFLKKLKARHLRDAPDPARTASGRGDRRSAAMVVRQSACGTGGLRRGD